MEKFNKDIGDIIDTMASLPIKYRLKWGKQSNMSLNNKRKIRRLCNKLKIENKIGEYISNEFVYGNVEGVI